MERRAVVTDIRHLVRDDQMTLQSTMPVPARPADAIERVSSSLVWCMENSYLMLDSPAPCANVKCDTYLEANRL